MKYISCAVHNIRYFAYYSFAMSFIPILGKHSELIKDLVDSDYDGNLHTLFADLNITEISVDDFVYTLATLLNFNDNAELKRLATIRVTQHHNTKRANSLNKTIECATLMQNLDNIIAQYESVELNDCYNMYTNDAENGAENNSVNDKENDSVNNEEHDLVKHKGHDSENDSVNNDEENDDIYDNYIFNAIRDDNAAYINTDTDIDTDTDTDADTDTDTDNDIYDNCIFDAIRADKYDWESYDRYNIYDNYIFNAIRDDNAAYINTDTDIDTDTDTDADTDTDDDADSDPNLDNDTDTDTDPNPNLNINADTDTDPNSNIDPATDTIINIAYDSIITNIKNIELELNATKLLSNLIISNIKKLNYEYHQFTDTINNLNNKFNNWRCACIDYSSNIGIENFLIACDKLKMTSVINSTMKLCIKLCTPMQQSLINLTTHDRDYDIASLYNKGYRFVYNNDITMHSNAKESDYSNAIRNGLHITKLIDNSDSTILYSTCKSLCKTLTMANIDATQYEGMSLCKYKLLTSLQMRGDITNINISNMPSLYELYCGNAESGFTKKNFFPASLRALYVNSCSLCIGKKSIRKCKFIEKLICDESDIESFKPFEKSLRILSASFCCNILDKNLRNCANIEKLDCSNNYSITTCKPFALSLRTLVCSNSNIDDNGLANCIYIEELDCDSNNNISTCKSFAQSLRILSTNDNSAMSDAGLEKCNRIEELYCTYTEKITTCSSFCNTLRVLNACNCNITDNGIISCRNINTIALNKYSKITTCKPFIKSLTDLYCDNNTIINATHKMRDQMGIHTALNVNKSAGDSYPHADLCKYFRFSDDDD